MTQKQLIEKIDALKSEADALLPITPEYEKVFWEKFRLEFNYNSNHLEGNTMTYGHTQLLLIFDKIGADYTGREVEEMKNHDVAMKLIKDAAFDLEHILTEKFMKEINQTILVRPYYNEAITQDGRPTKRLIEPGQYKKYPNSVLLANGEVFDYASPEETPALMGDLIDWYRKESNAKELHSVQIAALFHYRFVRIHPFDDSNGRTARLMMNYILMKNGYAPVVIESADKKNYLTALNKADTGDIEAFVDYIFNQSIKWQELILKAYRGESIEETDDFRKDIQLLKKKLKNIDDRVEFIFSKETLSKCFKEIIIPFLKKFINEISIFDDLFIDANVNIDFKTEAIWNSFSESSLEGIFDEILKKKLRKPTILIITYSHNKLRKGNLLELNYNTEIAFSFHDYSYSLSIESEKLGLTKYYHQPISDAEADKILAILVKSELNVIKNHLK